MTDDIPATKADLAALRAEIHDDLVREFARIAANTDDLRTEVRIANAVTRAELQTLRGELQALRADNQALRADNQAIIGLVQPLTDTLRLLPDMLAAIADRLRRLEDRG
jgi:cell division protein FtsB